LYRSLFGESVAESNDAKHPDSLMKRWLLAASCCCCCCGYIL